MTAILVELPNLQLRFHQTPWDDIWFDGRSGFLEILNFNGDNEIIKREFEAWTSEENIEYCGCKLEPEDIKVRRVLHAMDFYFIASTVEVTKRDLNNLPNPEWQFQIKPANEINFKEILKLNIKFMKHGRFHEDPYLLNFVQKRQELILSKQFENKDVQFFIAIDENNSMIGYSIFQKLGYTIELLHMGVNPELVNPLKAKYFWFNMFQFFKKSLGPRRIKGRLGLSNVGALAIYSEMKFMFSKPYDEYAFLKKRLKRD